MLEFVRLRMKVSIIAFTDNGMEIAYKLSNSLSEVNDVDFTRCGKGALSTWTEEHFSTNDALIFIGAIGIALRAIAPYIKTITKDPAVVYTLIKIFALSICMPLFDVKLTANLSGEL